MTQEQDPKLTALLDAVDKLDMNTLETTECLVAVYKAREAFRPKPKLVPVLPKSFTSSDQLYRWAKLHGVTDVSWQELILFTRIPAPQPKWHMPTFKEIANTTDCAGNSYLRTKNANFSKEKYDVLRATILSMNEEKTS